MKKNLLLKIMRLLKKYWLLILSLLILFCVSYATYRYLGPDRLQQRLNYQFSFQYVKDKAAYFSAWARISKLPQYHLEISDKKWQKFLEDPRDKTAATLFEGNKEYKVKIKCRGWQLLHRENPKKSIAVLFEDKLFHGKNRIDLILPEDRHYVLEHFNNYRAKKMDLKVPDSQFVTLKINGKSFGVYYETAAFEQEFLALSHLPDTADFYEGEKEFYVGNYLFGQPAHWGKITNSTYAGVDEDYAHIDKLIELMFFRTKAELWEKASDLIDVESFARWQSHSLLTKSTHQNSRHNLRFYFNPAKGKFEFMPWDNLGLHPAMIGAPIQRFPLHLNTLVDFLLSYPLYVQARNLQLWEYVKDDSNLEDDLAFFKQSWEDLRYDFYKDGMKKNNDQNVDQDISLEFTVEDEIRKLMRVYETNFLSTRHNLEINQLEKGTITQCPPSRNIVEKSNTNKKIACKIAIEINPLAASPAIIEQISFKLRQLSLNSETSILLAFDENKNKLFEDDEDVIIGEILPESLVIGDTITLDTFSNPDNPNWQSQTPLKISPAHKILLYNPLFAPKGFPFTFFLISNDPSFTVSNFSADIYNSTTGEALIY